MSLRQGDATGHFQMEAMNSEMMEHYFSPLKEMLEAHDMVELTCPDIQHGQVWDAVKFPSSIGGMRGWTNQEGEVLLFEAEGTNSHSFKCQCSRTGYSLPIVIFSTNKLNPSWTKGKVPGMQYGLSQNGWINTFFKSWFAE